MRAQEKTHILFNVLSNDIILFPNKCYRDSYLNTQRFVGYSEWLGFRRNIRDLTKCSLFIYSVYTVLSKLSSYIWICGSDSKASKHFALGPLLMAINSEVNSPIWPDFELVWDFMPVQVICKLHYHNNYFKDSVKTKQAVLRTRSNLNIVCFDAQRQVTPSELSDLA